MNCPTNDTCSEVPENIRQHPDVFASGLEVYYSLQTQQKWRRFVTLTSTHVHDSELFQKVLQRYPNTSTVYLRGDDLKKIQLEASTNVIATEVTDDDFFVSSDESINIAHHIERLLKVQHVSSESLGQEMWSAVFSNNDNVRPDITTLILNEIYSRNDSALQEALKLAVIVPRTLPPSSPFGRMILNDVSTVFARLKACGLLTLLRSKKASLGATFVLRSTSDENDHALLTSLLLEGRKVSVWNGEKFVVKPMPLNKIDLASFRTTTAIATVQIWEPGELVR
ncbi:hypothetical protein BV898_02150 [Hypsibius exemplaris]|uniref:Uncharacterized protein n=1 Tax=Hypsibius exemplaris TaxID=2072580 RepID=A0A1W0X9N1_HYPEX|nr:hypothetical protein BV898_02150 [Hypsibius exemplaris]